MASEYTYDEEGETWPFFVIAILTFILVPLTVKWVYRILNADDPISYNSKIKGSILEDSSTVSVENLRKIKEYQLKQKSSRFINRTLLVLILGWATVIYIALYYTKEADLTGAFDPYTILDISSSASEREIKSRYRKLSLKFHPDKLPKDITEAVKEEMETAFIKINMAYKALTDEVTRNNFLKYGHPDGPQNVSHGIALPKFLVEGKYSPFMVVVYFVLVGVLLPFIVGSWWNNVKTHTKKGLHVDTAALFTRKLTDRNPAKIVTPYDILDWVCLSHEVRTNFKHLHINQVRDLIAWHLFRNFEFTSKNPNFEMDKLKIVALLPTLINGLIDIATVFRQVDILITACDLRKSVIQAVKPVGKYQELLQLPYVDDKVVEKQPVKKLGKLFTLSKEELSKTLGIEDAEKLKTTMNVAAHIPFLRVVDAGFKVPGEDVVPPLSNAHLYVKFLVKSPKLKSSPEILEENLKDEETLEYLKNPLKSNEEQPALPYSYAPYFPKSIGNSWTGFLIAQKDNKLVEGTEASTLSHIDLSNLELTQEKWIDGKDDVIVSSFKIPMNGPAPANEGKTHYRLILKNNAYFGCDVDIPVVMTVKAAPMVLTRKTNQDVESDDESDISDPEEDTIAGALAAFRGGNVKKSEIKEAESADVSDESDTESIFTDINTDTEDEGDN